MKKDRKIEWVTVGFVRSESNPEKVHLVKYNERLGCYGCDCPAFRFQQKPIEERTCKHITRYEDLRLHWRELVGMEYPK